MGAGIKAKNAPNFPGTKKNVELTIQYFRLEDKPQNDNNIPTWVDYHQKY